VSYSFNPRSILRVQTILDELLLPDGEREWPSKNAANLAYNIRQAFTAAAHSAVHRKYAGLKERFVIRTRNGHVLAEPRVVETAEEGVKISTAKLTLTDVRSVEEAIGAACKHAVSELHLPAFPNDEEQLALLFRWTELNKMSIVNHYGAGVTLSRHPVGELKWVPSGT